MSGFHIEAQTYQIDSSVFGSPIVFRDMQCDECPGRRSAVSHPGFPRRTDPKNRRGARSSRELPRRVDLTWPAVEKRIQKELSLSNLKVLIVDRRLEGKASLETVLDSALRESSAMGAVSVTVSPDAGVQLHTLFYNQETGPPEYHRFFLGPSPTHDNMEVAAIKTREAVLAALYTRNPFSYADDDATENTDASRASPSQMPRMAARKSIQLYGAFGVAWSPGGVGAMGVAGGGLSVRLSRLFALRADGWISVPRREIKAAVGEATVRLITGRLGAVFLFRRFGPMQPAAGARIGILNLKSEGKSNTHPVTSVSKLLFYGSVFAEAGFEIADRVVVPISLAVGALAPGVDILFAGNPEAALNVFMLEAQIGLEVLL